jgi:Rps23 Pro-64 3,4-dihydroxylase Tpa1-like proline 4-hydroxylase
MSHTFHFDREHLKELASAHAREYRTNTPFPHIVLDDFVPSAVAEQAVSEFPGPNELRWTSYRREVEHKLEHTDVSVLSEHLAHLFAEFNSSVFATFLEELTGIEGVIPDPHLDGGGLHQIERGGLLKIHADFNWHERLLLDRRLNVILYLNPGWQPEWGGQLELWDATMENCVRRVEPLFNRCVIFSTTATSFHGHPEPLTCPDGVTRRSMAWYYFTNGRPAKEIAAVGSTNFAPRPGEVWRRRHLPAIARRWLPPAVTDAISRRRSRRQPPA